MQKFKYYFFIALQSILFSPQINSQSWIRINQLGYLPKEIKVAILLSKEEISPELFTIHDALTDELVYKSEKINSFGSYGAFKSAYRLDFSDLTKEGAYYIKINTVSFQRI